MDNRLAPHSCQYQSMPCRACGVNRLVVGKPERPLLAYSILTAQCRTNGRWSLSFVRQSSLLTQGEPERKLGPVQTGQVDLRSMDSFRTASTAFLCGYPSPLRNLTHAGRGECLGEISARVQEPC